MIKNRKILTDLWTSFLEMETYDSITNQYLLLEKYERAFNIQTKTNASPITLVTHNEATELYVDSLYERTVAKFIKFKIYEATGLSLTDFLNLPTYEVALIMRALTNVRKKENTNMPPIPGGKDFTKRKL